MVHTTRGSYFGTEIDGRWWKRFREDGFFARGNGALWLDELGLSFRRRLAREPLEIAWHEMIGVRLGRWHAGKWGVGRPVLKVEFERGSLRLSAGFLLSSDWAHMRALCEDLGRRIALEHASPQSAGVPAG